MVLVFGASMAMSLTTATTPSCRRARSAERVATRRAFLRHVLGDVARHRARTPRRRHGAAGRVRWPMRALPVCFCLYILLRGAADHAAREVCPWCRRAVVLVHLHGLAQQRLAAPCRPARLRPPQRLERSGPDCRILERRS